MGTQIVANPVAIVETIYDEAHATLALTKSGVLQTLRRKAGCVALLPCVATMGWIRSCVRYDLTILPWGQYTFCVKSMFAGWQSFRTDWVVGELEWSAVS